MRSEICNTPGCSNPKLPRKLKTGLCRNCRRDRHYRKYTKEHSSRKLLITNTLGPYLFQNGYVFEMSDLGDAGIKVGLSHSLEETAAIIIPLDEIEKIKVWFDKLIGRKGKTNKHLRLKAMIT